MSSELDILGISGTVDFAPASEAAEIVQNVRTILTTIEGTAPLDRELGVDASLLDAPLPVAQARLSARIVRAVERFEPRAEVVGVDYEGDGADGRLVPKVRVRLDVGA
jgi:phage baseplate assembly protein W